ncbi:hypothetical protein ACEQ8H_004053 [Pleosporales sp. CAS-2024a]
MQSASKAVFRRLSARATFQSLAHSMGPKVGATLTRPPVAPTPTNHHPPARITESPPPRHPTRTMADSYRPSRRDGGPPPPRKLAERNPFGSGAADARNHSDFTFESSRPAPRFPPSAPATGPPPRAPPRSNRGPRRNDRQRRNYSNAPRLAAPYYRRAATHERALLQHHDDGEEHTYGVSDGPHRFNNLDDLSDHQEPDMDESDASAARGGAVQDRKRKAPRRLTQPAAGDAVPEWAAIPAPPPTKWSNPDPYTALPCPSDTTGKKMDVVKLIRKAKNAAAAEKAAANNAVAANDDFISLGNDDESEAAASEDSEVDALSDLHIYEDDEEPMPSRAKHNASRPLVKPSMNEPTQTSGGRKRKAGRVVPIVRDWVASSRGINPTPWAVDPQAYKHLTKDPKKWLHNEILDFYDWVAPQQFEHEARDKLVKRISDALSTQRWFPHDSGRILCFGSYPAGLYLPTADMDLVYASDRLWNGGRAALDSKNDRVAFTKTLRKASQRLYRVGIAANPFVIAKARVPIIKFKDKMTGLDVDISFENLGGVQAQATFHQWKEEYPDMLYLVALVKQLLVMRGLNEVHTGGLGGYSIICLTVSYIQHAPKTDNLAECFMGFLKYYGKDFDLAKKRIQMNPPAILDKEAYGIDGRKESMTGLSIQDPNKPDNNISGGSRRVPEAFNVFAAAYDTLADRLRALELGQDIGPSILECIIGGNYESYLNQRQRLRRLVS